jgi:predicted transcriptional regulator of viral defense system
MVTRIQIAKPDILKEFSQGASVLRLRDVAEVFNQKREFWRLAKSMSLTAFVRFMTEKTDLRSVSYRFPQRHVSGYTWGDVPILETLLGLVEDSYLSHYTALRVHGLTEQVPKTIYFTKEKSSGSAFGREANELYDQSAIDAAFGHPPRASKNELELAKEQVRVVMLESAYQGSLGVTAGEVNWGGSRPLKLRYTSLERTMIDVVVRPFYAGGVFEVAKAFENAKTKLSVNAMQAMLKRMAFGYPYHQAIGYYLERAGYKPTVVELFRRLPMERDFYLTHNMGKTTYSSRWRLFVPEGF